MRSNFIDRLYRNNRSGDVTGMLKPIRQTRTGAKLPGFIASLDPFSKRQQQIRLQYGQAMTEYLIILALIAVAAIAVYQSFGQVIRSQTAGLARELAGESADQAVSAAKAASAEALKQKQIKTLKSYGSNSR